MRARKPRRIAPRLLNGEKREAFGHGLPPKIKAGLRAIAARENQSMSWVMEQVIVRYFDLPEPEYVERAGDRDQRPILPATTLRPRASMPTRAH